MRGTNGQPSGLFGYVSAANRNLANNPLHCVRARLDDAIASIGNDFDLVRRPPCSQQPAGLGLSGWAAHRVPAASSPTRGPRR